MLTSRQKTSLVDFRAFLDSLTEDLPDYAADTLSSAVMVAACFKVAFD